MVTSFKLVSKQTFAGKEGLPQERTYPPKAALFESSQSGVLIFVPFDIND